MNTNSKIYVAGHHGLVGSAICRELQRQGFSRVITRPRQELDLMDAAAVRRFFEETRPEYVFDAAARVGGIWANDQYPAEFLYQNLQVQTNLIQCAYEIGVTKFLFLGSSCIYPKLAPQPLKEEYLLSGPLEPTNEWYAIAKIVGVKMCQAYRRQYGTNLISVMPTNLYGPGDHYDLQNSHVVPALIRKFHEGKISGANSVTGWGSGAPRREFLYVDDLAQACVFLMQHAGSPELINVGFGSDLTIKALAETVAGVVGFQGDIIWDTSQPDGTPRKLLDSSRIFALGWRPQTDLNSGLRLAYADFVERYADMNRESRSLTASPLFPNLDPFQKPLPH